MQQADHPHDRSRRDRRAEIAAPYKHTSLFPLGHDSTLYRKLTGEGVRLERAGRHELLVVEREALRMLAEPAFTDINH